MKRIISFLLLFAFAASQLQAQSITDPVTLRNLTNQWVVPGGSISAVKLNSLLNGVLNVQAAGDSTLLILIKKWSDSVTIHNLQINGGLKFVTGRQGAGKILVSDANGVADWQTIVNNSGGMPVNLEVADTSANTYITLAHIPLLNTLVFIKNGNILPPFKYSLFGAVVQLVDTRVPSDIFLSNYKY